MASSMPPSTSTIRMILVGKTGNGKSSSGNTILRRDVFDSSANLSSATTACSKESTVIDGTLVEVMDTPGLFDTAQTHEETGVVIVQAFVNMHPGPDVFLYVIKLGTRYTQEEYKAYKRFKMLFGKKVTKHLVILFTGMDEIEEKGDTIEGVLASAPSDLVKVLQECEERYVTFNNKKITEEYDHEHAEKLIQMTRDLMKRNGEQPYTCNQYSKIGETLKEAVSKKLREIEDEEAKALRRTQELEEELREKVEEMDLSKAEYEKELTGMKATLKKENDLWLEDWLQKMEVKEEEIRAKQEEHDLRMQQDREREEHERKRRCAQDEQERKERQETLTEERKREKQERKRQTEQENQERRRRFEQEDQERRRQKHQEWSDFRQQQEEERKREEQERSGRRRREDEERDAINTLRTAANIASTSVSVATFLLKLLD